MSGGGPEAKRRAAIVALPGEVAAQIAAGEVIERPASIVKELIENGCDAGASWIEVAVTTAEGAVASISVRDDGGGIVPDQLALAFERHATSKLRGVADLERLRSYGFRGEALPSIAAVADVDCLSRAAGQPLGARLRIVAGRRGAVERAGAPLGTSIEISRLFARQPARRKFLAGLRAERAAIARVCGEAALARPATALRLSIDGRNVLRAPGASAYDEDDAVAAETALRDAFAAVWSGELAEAAFYFSARQAIRDADGVAIEGAEASTIAVRGLALPPPHHRGRRGGVQLFVNARPVQSRPLAFAVEQAYAELLPARRYPLAAVFLELPPGRIDVNVHPSKATVKLLDERAAFALVQRTVRETLLARLTWPQSPPSAGGLNLAEGGTGWTGGTAAGGERRGAALGGEGGANETARRGNDVPPPPWQRRRPVLAPLHDGAPQDRRDVSAGADSHSSPGDPAQPVAPQAAMALPSLPLLRVVGQLRSVFIVAEGPGGLVLIDQHAAHERVLYERLLGAPNGAALDVTGAEGVAGAAGVTGAAEGEQARQPLLDPPLLELTALQASAFEAHEPALARLGFECEPFGDRALRLRAVPAMLGEGGLAVILGQGGLAAERPGLARRPLRQLDARRLLESLLDDLAGAERSAARHDPVAASAACHGSVRAGQTLDAAEMRALLRALEGCDNPTSCPHGRPTMIEFGADDLLRRFGRR